MAHVDVKHPCGDNFKTGIMGQSTRYPVTVIVTQETAPTDTQCFWYKSSTMELYFYNGSAWIVIMRGVGVFVWGEYDDDVEAALFGVPIGDYYYLASSNPWFLPAGLLKRRMS